MQIEVKQKFKKQSEGVNDIEIAGIVAVEVTEPRERKEEEEDSN